MKHTIILFWTYHLRRKYLKIVSGQIMMIFMLDIGSHLGFDLWMTFKRKDNVFNVISVPKLVENEVLHYILGQLCRKLQIQEIDTYILVNICANFVGFIQKCKIVVISSYAALLKNIRQSSKFNAYFSVK